MSLTNLNNIYTLLTVEEPNVTSPLFRIWNEETIYFHDKCPYSHSCSFTKTCSLPFCKLAHYKQKYCEPTACSASVCAYSHSESDSTCKYGSTLEDESFESESLESESIESESVESEFLEDEPLEDEPLERKSTCKYEFQVSM